jgi:hypothetical protein
MDDTALKRNREQLIEYLSEGRFVKTDESGQCRVDMISALLRDRRRLLVNALLDRVGYDIHGLDYFDKIIFYGAGTESIVLATIINTVADQKCALLEKGLLVHSLGIRGEPIYKDSTVVCVIPVLTGIYRAQRSIELLRDQLKEDCPDNITVVSLINMVDDHLTYRSSYGLTTYSVLNRADVDTILDRSRQCTR